jgi:acyl carrier protein
MNEVVIERADAAQRVQDMVALVLQVSSTAAATAARDVTTEWDSIKHVELMFTVEQAFGVEFSGQEMADAHSTEALVDIVMAAMARADGA